MTNIECPKCGGILAGDWNEVECRKCGQRFNTLDVAAPAIRELDKHAKVNGFACYVIRFSESGTLIAVPVAYS